MMNLTEFFQNFGTEEKCIDYLKKYRSKKGISCKKCGAKKLQWNASFLHWRCKCGAKVSLKSGTIMESTKLKYHTWFYAIFLMTHTVKPYSILQLSKLLGIRRYRTVWYLSMKIRVAMGNQLTSKNYLDYIVLISGDKSPETHIKAIQHYSVAAIFKTKKKGKDEINLLAPSGLLNNVTAKEVELKNSGYRCVKILGVQHKIELKEGHFPMKPSVKKWMSNLKINNGKILNGIHHGVSYLHLQKYMFEFSFRYNMRFENGFQFFLRCI